jgi:Late exocytosis, associated with Golgi transport
VRRLPDRHNVMSTGEPDILQAIRDANTQSGQFGVTAIIAGLVTSAVISTIVFIAFSVLRPRHNIVYAPKLKYASEKRAPPAIDDGIFSWMKPVWQCSDEYLLDRIGLDAVVFLRFWRMCRNIFICLGIGSAVLIPFNVIVGLKTVYGQANVAKNKYIALLYSLIVVLSACFPWKESRPTFCGSRSSSVGFTTLSLCFGCIEGIGA